MAANSDLFAPNPDTLSGRNADIYFDRGRLILNAERLNPTMTMELFARRRGLLCGMRELHALIDRVLPGEAEVWSLSERCWIQPREVVLRVRAPYVDFALYETAMLGLLSSETGWATAAAECVAAAAGVPVICFGARHVHPQVSARMEYAAADGNSAARDDPGYGGYGGRRPGFRYPHRPGSKTDRFSGHLQR